MIVRVLGELPFDLFRFDQIWVGFVSTRIEEGRHMGLPLRGTDSVLRRKKNPGR